MPADLGTKVLSVQKFNQHKETMGMFLEGWKVLEKIEDGEQNETTFGMTQEAREKALKIIILVTKLALAGASNEEKKEISNALAWTSIQFCSRETVSFISSCLWL